MGMLSEIPYKFIFLTNMVKEQHNLGQYATSLTSYSTSVVNHCASDEINVILILSILFSE